MRISALSLRAVLLLLPAFAAVPAIGAAIAPSLFQDLHWRSIGPYRGGRVLAVAGSPTSPNSFYFGAVNGGVWRTDDAGRTWTPIFDAVPVGSVGAIAVAPGSPETIYVGTGEADMRSDIAQGSGLFRSTDGGATWRFAGLGDTQQISRILIDPRDPNSILVAGLGHPYGPNAERGVFRSTDGGVTWTKTLFKDVDTGAIDMAFQPGNPNVVYAALWQTRRPPWNVYPPSNGPGGGLYKSIDGGRTWAPILGHGLPAAPGRIGLATTPARPNRVYALIDADQGGLYRSDDAGANWTEVSNDKRIWARGWYFGGITADPTDADRVWVCDTILLRSDDGGAHFLAIKGDPTGDDFHSLWIDPANPARRVLGVDQGTLVTVNAGRTWSSWFNQPTGQFYHVATDNRFPYRVYGAQQDSGAAAVPSRTDALNDGITMQHFQEITAGGESDEIAPDPDDPDTIYGGRVDKLDLRSGQTRSVDPTLAFPGSYRGTWTLPLTFGKRDHALYFANQRIFRTVDGGKRWRPISPDLTRTTLTVPSTLDGPTAADTSEAGPRRGVVYDIGTSPLDQRLVWAGTDDGLIWRTRDGGGHWQEVTPAGLQPWSKIATIEPSHFDAGSAYVAVDRHRLDDFHPYILRTRDGGRSWTPIVQGIATPAGIDAVNVVREDPQRRGLLYAGTERGLYISFDDGDRWQPLQRGLPTTSVRDITIHDNDLVVATHGRGFYVMDDITPLRELAADDRAGLRLFPPAPAIRLHGTAFSGTPMPKDEPLAANPPSGAYIDYVLPQDAMGMVEIVILDGHGEIVNRFSSADPIVPADAATSVAAVEWLRPPTPPATTPGQHRFVWTLHYAPPAQLGDLNGESAPAGVWAPPGRYTVQLRVGSWTASQPLEIRSDPRIAISQEAFAQEFALAREIETAEASARGGLLACVDLQRRLARQAGTPRASEAGRLAAELATLADVPVPDSRNSVAVPPHTLDGLADIAARLAKLAVAVDGADAEPTADARAGFLLAKRMLDGSLARLEQLRQSVHALAPASSS